MILSNSDLVELTEFRRMLHRRPEVSGHEVETARSIAAALTPWSPDGVLTGLGGLATVVPALGDAAGALFGLGAIAWFLAIGATLLWQAEAE